MVPSPAPAQTAHPPCDFCLLALSFPPAFRPLTLHGQWPENLAAGAGPRYSTAPPLARGLVAALRSELTTWAGR